MARATSKPDPAKDQPPRNRAETTPPYNEAVTTAWLAESMMQLQHSMGEVQKGIKTLEAASDSQGKKVSRMSHVIYAAGVVLGIIVVVGGFILNKAFDVLTAVLKAH